MRGDDGGIRRFPGDHLGNGTCLSNYVRQISAGVIYDAPEEFISHRAAGFAFDTHNMQARYQAEGQTLRPIHEEQGWTIYRLPDGRHMIPQPGFTACTQSAEAMLLLDQGYIQPADVARLMRSGYAQPRRDQAEFLRSLQRNSGREPILKTWDNITQPAQREQAAQELQRALLENGPCMFDVGGHEVVLDAVTKIDDKWHFTLREPFHGSALTIAGHEGVLKNLSCFEAIFLPEKQGADTAS